MQNHYKEEGIMKDSQNNEFKKILTTTKTYNS